MSVSTLPFRTSSPMIRQAAVWMGSLNISLEAVMMGRERWREILRSGENIGPGELAGVGFGMAGRKWERSRIWKCLAMLGLSKSGLMDRRP